MSLQLTFYHTFTLFLFFAQIDCQFPKICSENLTNPDSVCCPTPSSFENPCGFPNRGVCSRIPTSEIPFSYSCQCFGKFFGPACEKRIFGYNASSACREKSSIRFRKKITSDEVQNLEKSMNLSRITDSAKFFIRKNGNLENVTWTAYFEFLYREGSEFEFGTAGFLTWQRTFLLEVENALSEMISGVTLPFWDWTTEKRLEFFGFEVKNCSLPDKRDVDSCLSLSDYDSDPLEINPVIKNSSFRVCVENLNSRVLNCLNLTTGNAFSDQPLLYLLHATFLDKIFSEWMQKNRPSILEFPRTSVYENIVPFYPPIAHAVVFSDTASLGYSYESEKNASSPENIPLWIVGVILCSISSLLVFVLVVTVQFKLGDNRAGPTTEINT